MVLEIFQSVMREGEKKRGKGRGIRLHATDRREYSQATIEPRPVFSCAYNGHGEDRILARKCEMFVCINYNASNSKGSSSETKAT